MLIAKYCAYSLVSLNRNEYCPRKWDLFLCCFLSCSCSTGLVQVFSSSGTLLGELGGVVLEDPASMGVATVASMAFLPCLQGRDGNDDMSRNV